MGWIPETVLVQIIATAGVILAAALPVYLQLRGRLNRIGDDAAEARRQTANTHTKNLREELDERHNLIMGNFYELARDIRGLRKENLSTRKDIGQLRAEDRAARRDTQDLRAEFRAHVKQTETMIPALEALVDRYAPEHNNNNSSPKKLPE